MLHAASLSLFQLPPPLFPHPSDTSTLTFNLEMFEQHLKLNLTYLIIYRSDHNVEKPLLSIAEGVPQACQHLTSLSDTWKEFPR